MPQTDNDNNREDRTQQTEIARRQQLLATIRARRKERVIAPLTAAQLVQIARKKEQ